MSVAKVTKLPTLICIDIQQGFLDEEAWGGNRNNKDAEVICARIINRWRDMNANIIHVRHSSTNPNSKLHESSEGFKFQPSCAPKDNERVITKSVNSCFIGTNLKQVLDDQNCQSLVIIGLTTDHCVSTTTRMAGNFGYKTYLISDATATFDKIGIDGTQYDSELIHQTALASLNEEFATVINSSELFKLF